MNPESKNKDANTAEGIIHRMVEAVEAKNEAALARVLGKSAQAVANAKKKDSVPPAWIFRIAKDHNVSLDWIVFGENHMQLEMPQGTGNGKHRSCRTKDGTGIQVRRRQHYSESEDRELAMHNALQLSQQTLHELYVENRELIRENADLKGQITELKVALRIEQMQAGPQRD